MNYEIYCEKKAERRIAAFEEKMKLKFPEGHPERNNYVDAVNDHLGIDSRHMEQGGPYSQLPLSSHPQMGD